MINNAILGVIAGARPRSPATSYFTYLAIGFVNSPYYMILDSSFTNIGAPSATREVYGFAYDRDRSNVLISSGPDSVSVSYSKFLNLGSLTLSNPSPALSGYLSGGAYIPALDGFVIGSQNTPYATLYNAANFSKISDLSNQPGSSVQFVDKSPDGNFVGMALSSGSRHIIYSVPSMSVVPFTGTNLGSQAVTISFNKDSDRYALTRRFPDGMTRIYTTAGENASPATLSVSIVDRCSVFHTTQPHIFIGGDISSVNYGQVFDYLTGMLVTNLSTNVGSPIDRASYSADGSLLAVAHGNNFSVFETTGYTRIHGPINVGSSILSLRFLEAVD